MKLNQLFERHCYAPSLTFLTASLLPLSWLFRSAVALRHFCYRTGLKKSHRFSVPIIVVGNITVGGTGKTPCVIGLADFLRTQGYKPGIVTRGVGGKKQTTPCRVDVHSNVKEVGDEAILLVKRTQCPVVTCIDRVAAVKFLLANTDCNIVISDDGLQHYRLQRDIEIVMIDKLRGLGNQQLLPAGPLRESIKRLNTVDFVIQDMQLQGNVLVSVKNETHQIPLSQFQSKRVHAVAAIGNPQRFFMSLREKGFDIIEHAFPDHYHFTADDLNYADDLPIIMTEKDAVKCYDFASDRCWTIPVEACLDNNLKSQFFSLLQGARLKA